MTPDSYFCDDYQAARRKFLAAWGGEIVPDEDCAVVGAPEALVRAVENLRED